MISEAHRDGAARKRDPVDPRESRAAGRQLFFDDTPSKLFYDCVPALAKFGNQCGLAATRTGLSAAG